MMMGNDLNTRVSGLAIGVIDSNYLGRVSFDYSGTSKLDGMNDDSLLYLGFMDLGEIDVLIDGLRGLRDEIAAKTRGDVVEGD